MFVTWEGTRRICRSWLERLSLCCAGGLLLNAVAIPLLAIEPQYSQNERFQIPFSADPAEMKRIGAVEVRLHVSTDGGATWSLVESVPPTSTRFTFQSPGDGAYVFAVQTIDKAGRGHPDANPQPSLEVVVDNTPPALTLGVSPVGPGQMEVVWRADDDNLDLSTLRIEYLDSATGAWQPLNAAPSAVGSSRFSDFSMGEVLVRGSVSDLAGNSTDSSGSGAAQTATPTETIRGRPDFRDPVARGDGRNGSTPLVTATASGGAMLPMILPTAPSGPAPTQSVSVSRMPTTPGAMTNAGSSPQQGLLPAAPDSLGSPVEPGQDNGNFYVPPLPAQDARHVNSRSFRVGYELTDIGPSGVGSVDLYISEDGGSRWFHYGSDADRQSPFDVIVPRDGQYGFTIRVRNGLGVVDDPPQPGEPAEVVVVVDQTPPTVRLMPLQQASAAGAFQVRIGWYVQDDRLADRPVALYQSSSADGPWEPITGWIENQGRYLWTVSGLAPRNIFVRLEARDAAGNVAEAVTDRPILIDTSRPSARILDIDVQGGDIGGW